MSKKTLVVICNYNLKDSAENLYLQLKPYEKDHYDTIILDNGSDSDKKSKLSAITLPENTFFSGGLQYSIQLVLSNRDKYDSLLFMISSLSLSGFNWVNALRSVLFSSNDIGIVSPTIISAGSDQNAWPQMRSWSMPTPRKVKWIDFQSPLFNIEFLEKIKEFPDFGIAYGYDIYGGIACENLGYKIYALDYVYANHVKKATIRSGNHKMNLRQYGKVSLEGMYKGFENIGLVHKLNEYRNWASNYTPIEL